MKTFKRLGQSTFLFALMLSILFLYGNAQAEEVNKTFKAKETVEIHTVSGDCVVEKGAGSEIKVRVVYTYPPDRFEPIFKEEGNTLILKEEFHSTGEKQSDKGKSNWFVTVPEKTNIDFASASGDLKLSGLTGTLSAKAASGDISVMKFKGEFKVKAASGDIEVTDSEIDMKAKVASGDIEMKNVKGAFEVSSASGDVEADGIEFTASGDFSSASGDVDVKLAKSPANNLSFKTASGDVTLDYNGNPVTGYVEFKGNVKNFSCPFSFDGGETSEYTPFGTKYFKKGGDSPKITLKSVSGSLKLKK
jgi:DUF4097 and DUF4098 domain-containing protein YvlB